MIREAVLSDEEAQGTRLRLRGKVEGKAEEKAETEGGKAEGKMGNWKFLMIFPF